MSFLNRRLIIIFSGVSVLFCSCRIEPLYHEVSQFSTEVVQTSRGESVGEIDAGLAEKFAATVVEEPSNRFGQMVRNHLLFLMYGNGEIPEKPRYKVSLKTSFSSNSSEWGEWEHNIDDGRWPSLGRVFGEASYTLEDMKKGLIAKGRGTVSVSFDRNFQEYATLQAERNAQKRAAEDLAEQVFMLLSKDFSGH